MIRKRRRLILQRRHFTVRYGSRPFFNYPYNALEEALVNAVLHKNYKEDVPVEIRIYLDHIQIINFSRPDHYIDMEKFAAGKVRARRYRNPKIGEFLRKLICPRRNLRVYQKFCAN